MGGGGGSNSSQINYQKEQAAQARQQEAERAARLRSGSDFITSLFDGTPKGQKTLDLSGFTAPPTPSATPGEVMDGALNMPGVFSNGTVSGGWNDGKFSLNDGYYVKATPENGNGGGYGVYDKDNSLIGFGKTADELKNQKFVYGGDINAREGGFGDDFYGKFKKANLDYYMPELDRQYAKKSSELNYGLARAGTLKSSVANDQLADLVYDRELNNAQLTAKADSATADLRNTVQSNRTAALNQLYSTEDPTLAANSAISTVRNVELTKPMLSPIGELFKPLAVGIGAGVGSYYNTKNYPVPGASNPNKGSGSLN